MRKAKNFDIMMSSQGVDNTGSPIVWALIYVPEGINPQNIQINAADANPEVFSSLFEPNQHVIASGVISPGQDVRLFSPLARNLNSGDCVVLQFLGPSHTTAQSTNIVARVNYAISL
jgi:hypothetical protein